MSCSALKPEGIRIAMNGKSDIIIALPANASVSQQFAGSELSKYLTKISGATFTVRQGYEASGPLIKIELKQGKADDGYSISTDNKNIILKGNSDRSILYAVYDFLGSLGCRWLAPDFDVYAGKSEIIPGRPTLVYERTYTVTERPAFIYRKLDMGGGRSHNLQTLEKMIDWMPKARFNTLMVPMNLENKGRTLWENYASLTPELKKRGITIEVGQHGYQNFLNAKMENGELFKRHPEWFGKDANCNPTPSEEFIFNTEDPKAVDYFINNIISYIKKHPELEIFDLWPPDFAKWGDCPELIARAGTPHERQARLTNKVMEAVKKIRPDLRFEIIAFSDALQPTSIDASVMVDICPIHQNFESQIFENKSPANQQYANAILSWRKKFSGDIGLYSYFRKYAWKSLPNVIPHYIQKDMQWYANVPLQGISSYAEPGDWYTYELNHYVLGHLAWAPAVNIDSLIELFCKGRYGPSYELGTSGYSLLEEVVRNYGNIRHTTLKSKELINKAGVQVQEKLAKVLKAQQTADSSYSANLYRLGLMLQYAQLDLGIQEARALHVSDEIFRNKIGELMEFFKKHAKDGTLALTGREDIPSFVIQYSKNPPAD